MIGKSSRGEATGEEGELPALSSGGENTTGWALPGSHLLARHATGLTVSDTEINTKCRISPVGFGQYNLGSVCVISKKLIRTLRIISEGLVSWDHPVRTKHEFDLIV